MMNAGVPGWGAPAFLPSQEGGVTGGNVDEEAGEATWTPAERALLDSVLEFSGAADGVIDYAGRERPQLRPGTGFDAVRQAMRALEARVLAAHAEGACSERIAEIARLEQEMVLLILRRHGAAPSPVDG